MGTSESEPQFPDMLAFLAYWHMTKLTVAVHQCQRQSRSLQKAQKDGSPARARAFITIRTRLYTTAVPLLYAGKLSNRGPRFEAILIRTSSLAVP